MEFDSNKEIIVQLKDNNRNVKYLTVSNNNTISLGKKPRTGGFALSSVFLQTSSSLGKYNYNKYQQIITENLLILAWQCN